MYPQSTESASPFSEKFQALYELLIRFAAEAQQMHAHLKVQDDASRAVYTSLSRISGFSDQLHMVLCLMRDDVRVVEELSAGLPAVLGPEQFEDSYYHWVRLERQSPAPMH